MKSLFVTGASGFLGSHLLPRFSSSGYDEIRCLTHRAPAGAGDRAVVSVRGDLLDEASYSESLEGCEAVLHLAAATGKAGRSELMRVNTAGTRALLRACEARGIARMVYVSSIAAKFEDAYSWYPYAESKKLAEDAIRQSRLRYTIVRPTIILGRGSPIGRKLRGLVQAFATFVPGPGTARIQPIDAGDLAETLLDVLRTDRFHGETLEVGGPDILTIEEFLRRLHELRFGGRPRVIRAPVRPVRAVLAQLERLPLPLPVRAGQLASFLFDGVAAPNDLTSARRDSMKGVDALIGDLIADA